MLGIFACHKLLAGPIFDFHEAKQISEKIGGDLFIEELCVTHTDQPKTHCYPCQYEPSIRA